MKIELTYAVLLVAIVAVVVYMFAQSVPATTLNQLTAQQAAEKVKGIYELQYETPVEIVSVNETSGLYGVTIRINVTGAPSEQQTFVTKDGRLIADRLIIADNYQALLSLQKTFVDCLASKSVRVFGSANDTATLQQLAVLGNYGYKLFVSCDAPNTQACIDYGVQRIPTTAINNTGYDASIYNLEFYSQLSGCALPTLG